MSYTFGFFLPLVGIVLLIFLLSLIQSSLHELSRARREQTTIVVLGFTAIFALGTVAAAIYSNWVFMGQLGEMQTASELTRKSNQINREAFTAVQRAFVIVTSLDIQRGSPEHYVGGMQEAQFWMMIPRVENTGNTPTRNLRWVMEPTITVEAPNAKDIPRVVPDMERQDLTNSWNYGVLGPKATMSLDFPGNKIGVLDSQIPSIGRNILKLLFHGIIRYNDVFPDTEEHITTFCYWMRVDVTGPDPSQFVFGAPYGAQCGGHTNCADSECQSAMQ